ncbi:MAG: PAS domain-containing protein, partial [Deltaproteobacteria bacterium]
LLGYSREELLTLSIHDVETNISTESILRRIESSGASGHARFETSLCCKDGSMVDVEISATHIKVITSPFGKGGFEGIFTVKDTSLFLSIVRDITRHRMDEAEKARIVALEQSVQGTLEETLAVHAVASSNNVNLREQLFESNKYLEWRHHHKNRFCGQGFQNHPNHCRRFRHWHCLGIPGKNL